MKALGIVLAVCLAALVVWLLARRQQTGEAGSTMKGDFRIDARALDQDDGALAWAVIEPIWGLPTGSDDDEQLPRDWGNVTPGQLHVYAVTWVEREVNNGGFWQYLHNTSADLPTKALKAFQQMGATEYAELVKRAVSAFPGGTLPKTRNSRMKLLPDDPYEDVSDRHRVILDELNKLDDAFFDLYGDGEQFYKLIAEYVRAHPEQFFR